MCIRDSDTGVEVGVLHAVPEVGSVQVELSVCALSPGHDAAGCVLQLDGDSALAFHDGLDPDVSLAVLEGGGDLDAGVAEVAQSDVVPADHHQADVAVDAAVECKVGLLGVDAVVDAVVHLDGELVILCQQVGDMDTEGGVAAVVGADVPAVQQNFGAGIDALELHLQHHLCRSGGEDADLPSGENGTSDNWISGQEGDGNYLALSAEEVELLQNLKALKDNGTFKKIVVLINSSNAIELDFLNPEICGEDYGIDAAMWIGDVGQTGINGVGQLLSGAVTPSGSLVDTYLYDNMAYFS